MQKALDRKFLDWDAECLISVNCKIIFRISGLTGSANSIFYNTE